MRKTSVQKFSHCVRVAIIVGVRVGVRRVRGVWVAFENKNKPVSPPSGVSRGGAQGARAPPSALPTYAILAELRLRSLFGEKLPRL